MCCLGVNLNVLHELILGLNFELPGTVHPGIATSDLLCHRFLLICAAVPTADHARHLIGCQGR